MNESTIPNGKLILRTLAMPSDTNPNGDIFGGWIMSQMDIAGGLMAREITNTRIATVAVEAMKFIKPVKVGDTICIYADLNKMGNTSITLEIAVWIEPVLKMAKGSFSSYKVTEAKFTYVAVDENGKKLVFDR